MTSANTESVEKGQILLEVQKRKNPMQNQIKTALFMIDDITKSVQLFHHCSLNECNDQFVLINSSITCSQNNKSHQEKMNNCNHRKKGSQFLNMPPAKQQIKLFTLSFILQFNSISWKMRKSQKSFDSYLPMGIKHKRQQPQKTVANVANTRYPIIQQVCLELNYRLSHSKFTFQEDIMWKDTTISSDFLATMQQHQKVNHFPGMLNLSRKRKLAQNIKRMQNAFPDSYSFLPLTFVLPQDISALRKFQDKARFKGQRPTFIIKQQSEVTEKGTYLWQNNIELQARPEVVQLYIERPLLYKGLKFDFRVYVLVTCCNPLRLYIFNQGLVRLATQSYQRPNGSNIEDLQMHLTNYSINKVNSKYIQNESIDNLSQGHKKSMAGFFQLLKSLGLPAYEYWSNMKDIAVKSLIAGLPWLKNEYEIAQPLNKASKLCFEILGLNFLIQDNHQIHLLSINHSPSLNTGTPLDYLVKSTLIRDTLRLVKKQHQLRTKLYQNSGKNMQNRKKQIIISSSDQAFSKKTQPEYSQQTQQIDYQLLDKDLGTFERIYPSQNVQKQQKYTRLLSYSLSSFPGQKSPLRKKQDKTLSFKRRSLSQTSNIVPQTNQNYYPSKQTIKLPTLEHSQRVLDSRGVYQIFDRESFKQQIKSRHKRQYQHPKRREVYHLQEQARAETTSNAPQLYDILQKHQKVVQGQAYQGENLLIARQTS